jgi:pentatricopeptide repeat-containing protein PET309
MLERVPGCLEHTLHRLFREHKNCLRSRRMLHSAFWSHGAGEIDPTSWWSLLLTPSNGTSLQNAKIKSKRGLSQNPSEWLFLDFLYPHQTLAFLQSFSSYGLNTFLNRRRKAVCQRGSRSYTSVSEVVDRPQEAPSDLPMVDPLFREIEFIAKSRHAFLEHIFKRCGRNPTDFDHAWHAFHRLESRGHYAPRLIAFLSYSTRWEDYERMVALISMVLAKSPGGIHFARYMNQLTRLGDIDAAYARLCKGMAEADLSRQSTYFLSKLVERKRWSFAAQLLKEYDVQSSVGLNWADVDQLSTLPVRLEGILDVINNQEASVEPSRLQDLRHLASRLAVRVFKQPEIMGELPETKISSFFTILRSNDILTRTHFIRAILSLLATKRELGISESLYRLMLEDSSLGRPPQSVLGSLLRAFCDARSYWGIRKILADFNSFYGGPDEESYQMLLTTYARSGDVNQLHQTFDEYCSRFGRPTNLEFLTPLIYVHARVGDVQRATNSFNRIKDEFKVTPNVVCWNILLMAYARAGDLAGAFDKYKELIAQPVEPDVYTFGTVMGMLANRGDTEGVRYMLDMALEKNIKLNTSFIDTQVEALCHNGEVIEAIELLKSAVHMDLNGSRTRMWNILLSTFALHKDAYRALETLNRMRRFKIPFDDMTYAALMGCLIRMGRTDSALQMLISVMPREGFLPKPFHYALILQGFAHEGNRDMVTNVYRKMVDLYKKPNLSANLSILMTAIKRDLHHIEGSPLHPGEFELPHAENFLKLTLKCMNFDTLANKDPQPGLFGLPLSESFPAGYFERLVATLGSRGAFKKVDHLFHEYLRIRTDQPAVKESVTPPMRLLSALMVSHLRRGEHHEVAELWNLVVPKAIQIARHVDLSSAVNTSPPPPTSNLSSLLVSTYKSESPLKDANIKILPSQRFILAVPFKFYMNSLAAQGRYTEISLTISSLERIGFALSTKNWNNYIQILSVSLNPNDQLSAFILCEALLMPNFPLHWRMMTAGYGTHPLGRKDWLTNKSTKKVYERYYPGHLQPTYITMVYLGAAFLRFRERSSVDGGEEMAKLRKQAPETTEALAVMPKLKDKPQGVLLRGYPPWPDLDKPESGRSAEDYPVRRDITVRRVVDSGPRRRRERRKDLSRLSDKRKPLQELETPGIVELEPGQLQQMS